MRGHLVGRVLPLAVFALLLVGPVPEVGAQLAIGGDPRVNPGDFRITVFANGLDFPNGIAMLPDGSLLVGSSAPTGGSYFNSTGRLLRFVDANRNGVADAPGTIVANNLPGLVSGPRIAGNHPEGNAKSRLPWSVYGPAGAPIRRVARPFPR